MIRAVLDTNVFISGFIHPEGAPGLLGHALQENRFIVCLSVALYEELSRVLQRSLIRRQINTNSNEIEEFLRVLREKCSPGDLYQEINPSVIDDPADVKVLQAALACNADFIVSGDHHLLELHEFRGIPIVTPREFLDLLPEG